MRDQCHERPLGGSRAGSHRRSGRRGYLGVRVGSAAIDLAARDWARREQAVAERLRRVDNRRMDYMRSLFGAFCLGEDDVEIRCMIAFSLCIGNHFVAADHGGRSRADVLALALRWLEGR